MLIYALGGFADVDLSNTNNVAQKLLQEIESKYSVVNLLLSMFRPREVKARNQHENWKKIYGIVLHECRSKARLMQPDFCTIVQRILGCPQKKIQLRAAHYLRLQYGLCFERCTTNRNKERKCCLWEEGCMTYVPDGERMDFLFTGAFYHLNSEPTGTSDNFRLASRRLVEVLTSPRELRKEECVHAETTIDVLLRPSSSGDVVLQFSELLDVLKPIRLRGLPSLPLNNVASGFNIFPYTAAEAPNQVQLCEFRDTLAAEMKKPRFVPQDAVKTRDMIMKHHQDPYMTKKERMEIICSPTAAEMRHRRHMLLLNSGRLKGTAHGIHALPDQPV